MAVKTRRGAGLINYLTKIVSSRFFYTDSINSGSKSGF